MNSKFGGFCNPLGLVNSLIQCCSIDLNPCLIITADRNGGKTTRFRELTELLHNRMPVTGFIAESNEDKSSYCASNIITGKIAVLMEQAGTAGPGDFIHGRYIVHQQRFNLCTDEIISSYTGEIIAIDEVGKIELNGRGWFSLMDFSCNRPLIITVREQFVSQTVIELLGNRTLIMLDKPQIFIPKSAVAIQGKYL